MKEKAKNLLVKIPCVPSTSGLETKINEILQQNGEKTLIYSHLSSAAYFVRKIKNGETIHTPAGTLFLAELWFKKGEINDERK